MWSLVNDSAGQFYESALTDHKNSFLFITQRHEKTHGKSLQKRIDLKTEDGHNRLLKTNFTATSDTGAYLT